MICWIGKPIQAKKNGVDSIYDKGYCKLFSNDLIYEDSNRDKAIVEYSLVA